jgi:hypothetical protein
MRFSKPGHRTLVATVAPRGPGRYIASLEPMNTTIHDSEALRSRRGWLSPLILISLVACLYIFSLGPVLRYSGKTVTVTIPGAVNLPSGGVARGRTIPTWVSTLYRPVLRVLGSQLTPSNGKHDPINTYKAYLQWWHDRP